MSGYEPPDDPSEAPTGLYDYSGEEQGSPQRSTWYRNPIVLVALGLFVAILLGLAFYLLADQTNGTGGTTQTPTSPTTATVTPTSHYRGHHDHRTGRSAGNHRDDRPADHHRAGHEHPTDDDHKRGRRPPSSPSPRQRDPLAVSGYRPPYDDYSRGVDETERFSVGESPSPWYLKRWVLALWGLAVVVLIAVIIYGLAILARGNGGSAPAPTTTRTSTPTSSQHHHTVDDPVDHRADHDDDGSDHRTLPPSATWTPQHPRRHWWRSNLPPIPPIPHF